jgi:uncharacterized protein YejL (UPF0352 family)
MNIINDEHLLDLVEEVMRVLRHSGSPENASLVLLGCHAMNYEMNANKDISMSEYMKLYDEQFRGFFRHPAEH